MQGIFRFWGFSPETWSQSIGRSGWLDVCRPAPSRIVWGRVEPSLTLLEQAGPFRPAIESGWWSWFIVPVGAVPKGECLARLQTSTGESLDLVTRSNNGRLRVHFEVDASLDHLRQERYTNHRVPLYARLGIMRLALPGSVRMAGLKALRILRSLRGHPGPSFPNGPLDPSVDFWLYWLRERIVEHTRQPHEPLWPEGKRCAVVLTHDIDTNYCFRRPNVLENFVDMEARRGLCSTWIVVSSLLDEGRAALDELHRLGNEIGFHSHRHDHRLAFLSPQAIRNELRQMLPLRERYGTSGFRSPNYLRTPRLFRVVDEFAEYDATVPSFARCMSAMSPRTDGCSTCWPFVLEGTDLIELPNTLMEDLALEFEGCTPGECVRRQRNMVDVLRDRQSLISVCTHPEPQLTARPEWREAYRQFVDSVAGIPDVWHARAVDVCRHWRHRAARIAAQWTSKQHSASLRVSATRKEPAFSS